MEPRYSLWQKGERIAFLPAHTVWWEKKEGKADVVGSKIEGNWTVLNGVNAQSKLNSIFDDTFQPLAPVLASGM